MIFNRLVKIKAVTNTLKLMWHASAYCISDTLLTTAKTIHLYHLQNYSIREKATVIAIAEMGTFVLDNTPAHYVLSSNLQGKYKKIKFINPQNTIGRVTIIDQLQRIENFQEMYVQTVHGRQLIALTGYAFRAVMEYNQHTFTIEKGTLRIEPNENIINPLDFPTEFLGQLANIDEIYIHEEIKNELRSFAEWWRVLKAINQEMAKLKLINFNSMQKGFANLLQIKYDGILEAFSKLTSFTFSYFGFGRSVDDQVANINKLCDFLRANLGNLNELGLVSENKSIDENILAKIPNSQLESFEWKERKYYLLLIDLRK